MAEISNKQKSVLGIETSQQFSSAHHSVGLSAYELMLVAAIEDSYKPMSTQQFDAVTHLATMYDEMRTAKPVNVFRSATMSDVAPAEKGAAVTAAPTGKFIQPQMAAPEESPEQAYMRYDGGYRYSKG